MKNNYVKNNNSTINSNNEITLEGYECLRVKAIKGYENRYAVTSDGSVISFDYHRTGEAKELSQIPTRTGYMHVLLYDAKGNAKWHYVHRLVAEAFIPNPMYLDEINHISENKKDCSVENLEWCTHRYNCNFGTVNERRVATRKANKIKKQEEKRAAWNEVEEKRAAYEESLNNFNQNYLS